MWLTIFIFIAFSLIFVGLSSWATAKAIKRSFSNPSLFILPFFRCHILPDDFSTTNTGENEEEEEPEEEE